jgi:hypothetical protein
MYGAGFGNNVFVVAVMRYFIGRVDVQGFGEVHQYQNDHQQC